MDSFTWKPEYSVGDAALDGQHRGLIGIMNRLRTLLQSPALAEAGGEVEAVFDDLARYIAEHFAYEELRMADAGYPLERLAEHRHEHDELVRHVRSFHAEVAEGRYDGLQALLPYLYGEWLIHHICTSDMDYRPYLGAD